MIGLGISPFNSLKNSGFGPGVGPAYFIIIAGQSNGTDRYNVTGNLPALLQGVQANRYTYFKSIDNSSDNGSFVQIETGVNTQAGTPQTGKFGVQVVLANRLLNTYGSQCYCVPCAIGGTYIANDITPSWNSTHAVEYFDRMYDYFVKAAYFKSDSITLKPVLVWVHGESDSDTVAHGQAYEANVTALINKLRSKMYWADLPIILPKVRSDYGGTNLGLTDLRAGQVNLSNNVTNVFLIDTDTTDTPLSTDGQHYNPIVDNYSGTLSAINLGNKIADAINTNVKPINQSYFNLTSQFADDYSTGAAHAYFYVKVKSTATLCFRLRRGLDDAEIDIGFFGDKMDEAAVISHCAGSIGYVVTKYDQIGTNHLTQSTKANQPIICSGGVVFKSNYSPAEYYDNAAFYLNFTTPITSASSWSIFNISQRYNAGPYLSPMIGNTGATGPYGVDYSDARLYLSAGGTAYFTDVLTDGTIQNLQTYIFNGTGTIWKNDVSKTVSTFAQADSGSFTTYGRKSSAYAYGYSNGLLIYNTDKTSSVSAINQRLMAYFKIS